MVEVTIFEDRLVLEVEGLDKLWSLTSRLTLPLAHVRGAYANPVVDPSWPGLRFPGTYVPGVITAGTFYQDGQRIFWDVHNPTNAVVFELDHERYDQLIVEVRDPQAVVRAVWSAMSGHGANETS
ncbi:MAG: hypothetical protein RLZZ387_4095 [Chloroflexota bacterium]|jgi:hypothetical protein